MEVVYPCCCGLDVHTASITACVLWAEGGGRARKEKRRFGTFTRSVGVPQGTTEDDISASYENGVLEVHLKKPEQPKPRKIEIGGKQPKTIEGTAQEA